MAERQIRHRKSSLVLSARFPVANWRCRPVAKSAWFYSKSAPSLLTVFIAASIAPSYICLCAKRKKWYAWKRENGVKQVNFKEYPKPTQWLCYLCVLCPWRIKIPKDTKQFVVYVTKEAKIDWSIWRYFCKMCDFYGCSCGCCLTTRISFSLCCAWK